MSDPREQIIRMLFGPGSRVDVFQYSDPFGYPGGPRESPFQTTSSCYLRGSPRVSALVSILIGVHGILSGLMRGLV